MDIEKAITDGIVFKGGKSPNGKNEADIRKKRANRHKGK